MIGSKRNGNQTSRRCKPQPHVTKIVFYNEGQTSADKAKCTKYQSHAFAMPYTYLRDCSLLDLFFSPLSFFFDQSKRRSHKLS